MVTLIGMGSGVNVIVAQHLGAKEKREVMESIHTALLLCLLIPCTAALWPKGGSR